MTVERVCPLAKFTEHGSEGKSAMCRNKPEVHLSTAKGTCINDIFEYPL